MQIEVVTLFPELIREALKFGVVGRAIERGIVRLGCEDPRGHSKMSIARSMTGRMAVGRAWCSSPSR